MQGSGAAHLYKQEGRNKEAGESANEYRLIQEFLEIQETGSYFHEMLSNSKYNYYFIKLLNTSHIFFHITSQSEGLNFNNIVFYSISSYNIFTTHEGI